MKQMNGDLYFTHHTAYRNTRKQKVISSDQMFDTIQKNFLKVFEPPMYPITYDQIPFTTPLIDPAKPPEYCKLYSISLAESDK